MATGGDDVDLEEEEEEELGNEDALANHNDRTLLVKAVRSSRHYELRPLLTSPDRLRENDVTYALRLAVRLGDVSCVQVLLQSLVYSCNFLEDVASCLVDAAIYGHCDVTRLLLNNGANVNHVRTVHKRAALHEAAQRGHRAVCEVLLDAGANANQGDRTWMTPLMVAAEHNQLAVIEVLVGHGSLVNIKDKYGESALYKAVDKAHLESTELLLGMSADCNVRKQGKFGNTLMHVAAKRDNPRILRLLLASNESSMSVANFLDQTPFHVALLSGGQESIELLLDHGADPNRVDHEWTPLMRAASRGMPAVVRSLLGNGALVNARNMRRRTALHKAATSGCREVAQLLTAARADVNASCCAGYTPLHLAAAQAPSTGCWEVLLELLRSGSDVNLLNSENHNPSRLALTDFYLPTARLLHIVGAHPKHIRSLIRNCMENMDSVINFLCGTVFRHFTVYDADVIRDNVMFLHCVARNPRTLKNLSCMAIRRGLQRDIEAKSQVLPLPNDLKDLVNFSDIMHIRPYFVCQPGNH